MNKKSFFKLWKEFFKFTKIKIIYLIIIALIILISGSFANNVIFCFMAPCNQAPSTIIGQKIYSVITFNEPLINTQFALTIKNFMQDTFGFSAGTVYRAITFAISMILHFILISAITYIYNYFKKKP